MRNDLKKAIILWLFENANVFNRVNACTEHFRAYIFGADGNFLEFGGEEVHKFIVDADALIFKRGPITL